MNINLSKEAKATLAVITSNTVFGFSFVFSKIALGYASPMVLLANRFLIAFLALNLVLLTGKVKLSFRGKKLWKLLIEKEMNKTELRIKAGISTGALAKLGKNENVNTEILAKICKVLECGVDDVMEFIPEDEE